MTRQRHDLAGTPDETRQRNGHAALDSARKASAYNHQKRRLSDASIQRGLSLALSDRSQTGGQASVYVTTPSDRALQVLLRGATLRGSRKLLEDPKLLTALKLYAAYFTEQSATARFLTLIMSLEAPATSTLKSGIAIDLLERWSSETQALLVGLPKESEEAAALDALQRELLFRKDDSIRSQIRKLVLRELADDPKESDRAREVVRLYDLRSTLVHQGYLEVRQLDLATSDAKALVHRVLQTRFQRVTEAE